MANQISVNSGSGNITVTTSRSVIGTVANVASANFANFAGEAFDVSLANVTGAGNVASINLDGSASNVLYGNGIFAPAAGGNTANANFANFAGTAFSVDGGNVVGAVANATFATTAGSADTANSATVAASANSVSLANVSGAGNIASINLDGSASNVLYGNGVFAAATTGNVANANFANFAGTAFSVDGGNVVGAVANATFATDAGTANVSNIALSVDGANVNGAVANATFATSAGSANTANTATFATDAGNANIANIALSVDGANVNGAVANAGYADNAGNANTANTATFATDAGNANIANIALSVDGANVNGAVANATFATDAGNANIANIALSVDVANVSNIGNIATINLDGNASNFLDGTGNFVAAPGGANANFANFAGEVTTSAQPNITSVGNLTSLTIDANVANSTTIQTDPNIISFAGSNYYGITNAYGPGGGAAGRTRDAKVLTNYNTFEDFRTDYYGSKDGGNARAVSSIVRFDANIGNSNTDPLMPGTFQFNVFTPRSNLANANTSTFTAFGVDAGGGFILVNSPSDGATYNLFNYGGFTNPASQTGLLFNRRNGNGDARTGVVASDYLGNIEWRGAATSVGGFNANSTRAKIAPRVDSSYAGAGTGPIPVGIDFEVGNTVNVFTHSFHSNGNVTFDSVVTADEFVGNVAVGNVVGLGNIATVNLDGNASNFLDGTGNFVAAPGGANANFANFAGEVINSAQPNITSVGNLTDLTVTGNTQGNMFFGSNITFNGNAAVNNKLTVQADLPGAASVRVLGIQGGNITTASTSNTTAGGVFISGGQSVSTDAGNVFIARGGGAASIAGTAATANGDAFAGGAQLNGGFAQATNGNATSGLLFISSGTTNVSNGTATVGQATLNGGTANATNGNAFGGLVRVLGSNARTNTSGNALGGNIIIAGGNATSNNGSATSGSISIFTSPATAIGSGTATVGSVSIDVGAPNGVDASVPGNINIGTNGSAGAINIGTTGVPINLNGTVGNLSASGIQNGNSSVVFTGPDGDLNISTNNLTNAIQISGRQIYLNGANTGPSDIAKIDLIDGALNWTLDNTNFGGGTPFGMARFNSGFLEPLNFFTARGNSSSPADVQSGDNAYSERVQVLYDGNTRGIFNGDVSVQSFSGSDVAGKYTIGSYDDQANSVFQVNFGTSNIAGNLQIGSANSFLKLASIDSSVLANITGQGGQVAAVDDNGGKLAYWDTTNNRWSYVFDNSAV